MIDVCTNKRIILGVTGSIACYKALELASTLVQSGALVDVILTNSATGFVTPLAFTALTHRPVISTLFGNKQATGIEHVALAEKADLAVVAPATANIIAKIAQGIADDALTTILLATRARIIVAPAMDGFMYENPATQDNLRTISARGITIVGPDQGRLASGISGTGRLVESRTLVGHIRASLGHNGDLAGKTVLVSAGGTQEPVDPIRVITNRSSGKMGYALAQAARDRGAHTILVTAPTNLPNPVGVETIQVKTGLEMKREIDKAAIGAQVLIMAAAVSDYRPKQAIPIKIKKREPLLTLELERTPDILTEIPSTLVKVGFAAETNDILENAKAKLRDKQLDFIVANDITDEYGGFGSDFNKVLILSKDGLTDDLPRMPKVSVAHKILDKVITILR